MIDPVLIAQVLIGPAIVLTGPIVLVRAEVELSDPAVRIGRIVRAKAVVEPSDRVVQIGRIVRAKGAVEPSGRGFDRMTVRSSIARAATATSTSIVRI